MNKIKLILVDDEVLIRKLIRMKMDAERLNIEIVGEYSDAKSALLELEELRPDIIVTDICMPEIDGINFCEQCSKMLPGVKVIIITGYDDFDYARRSLKAGVHDFLMKPVQREELNTALEKLILNIWQERERAAMQKQMQEEWDKNQILLRDTYLKNLLINDVEQNEIEKYLRNYGIDTELCTKNGIYVGILAVYESVKYPEILGQVRNETKSFFRGEKNVYTVIDLWGRLSVIYCGEFSSFEEYFELLTQYLAQKWNYQIEYGVSKKVYSWREVYTAYSSALQDMYCKHGEVKEELKKTKEISGNVKGLETVLEYIDQGKAENALLAMDSVWLSMKKESFFAREEINYQVEYLLRDAGDKSEPMKAWVFSRIDVSRSNNDIKKCIQYLISILVLEKAFTSESEKGRMIRKIITYLRENIQNPKLSVNVLIEEFSVSSSYLNRLFKGCVGKTYSEFVSDLRYGKMLNLMNEEPDMRDRQIGELIGLTDAHYLSIWFRKMSGYSVTEYRKLKKYKEVMSGD